MMFSWPSFGPAGTCTSACTHVGQHISDMHTDVLRAHTSTIRFPEIDMFVTFSENGHS